MMNCRPAEPLPADLEEFFNGSGDEGVVYVSFGSALQASKMPESKIDLQKKLILLFSIIICTLFGNNLDSF